MKDCITYRQVTDAVLWWRRGWGRFIWEILVAFLTGLERCRDAILPSVGLVGVTAARGLLGTVPLVGRSLNRVVWFRGSASLRGECDLPLVFDAGTTRVYRSDITAWLRNSLHKLWMGILSGRSSKGSGMVETWLNSRR